MRTKKDSKIIIDFKFCLEDKINKTKQILTGKWGPYSVFQ